MSDTSTLATGAAAPPSRARRRVALLLIAVTQLVIVLDSTVVTVALPHMQDALSLSTAALQWVVTAYTLVSGGLLLFGGRLGDIMGRRSALLLGVAVFTAASLFGGLAQNGAWLIIARVVQGIGAAVMAPATLALIFDNFEEGPPRNRAMGVWAAMSSLGGAVGLVAGGLLTTYASWRWTFFVNIPIGIAIVVVAPLVLTASRQIRERIDIAGAVTATAGIAALIYGLSSAAPSGPYDVSHWGSWDVVVSLVLGVVLLVAFVVIEAKVSNPLLPLRVLAARDRAAAYLIAGCIGAAYFGLLFFLTLFLQEVLGYSPIQTGLAFLPWVATFAVAATVSGRLLPRVGARGLMIIGSVLAAGGLFWLAQISEHSGYAGSVVGPLIIAPLGIGLMAVPLGTLAMSRIRPTDAGVASSVLNVGQQVGASIGIAALGTAAWTSVSNRVGHQQVSTPVLDHALTVGFDLGFTISACVILLVLPIAVFVMARRQPTAVAAATDANLEF